MELYNNERMYHNTPTTAVAGSSSNNNNNNINTNMMINNNIIVNNSIPIMVQKKPNVPKCIDKTKTLLPLDFQPSNYSIICGNKRKFFNSPGNTRLRDLVESFIPEFSRAQGKLEKGVVVSKVMDIVKEACPVGAFVAFEKGRWWQVSERTSREKVGSLFRDFLSDKYKSSAQNKIARRKTKRAEKRMQKKLSSASSTKIPENVASLAHSILSESQEDQHDEDSSISSASCSFYDVDDLRPVQLEDI
jgi:hypothetical protein